MRHGRWATSLALISLMAAAEARGQHAPRPARSASYHHAYRTYYSQPETPSSPSDAPIEAEPDSVLAPPAPPGDANVIAPPPASAHGGNGFIYDSCDPPCVHGCYNGSACPPACTGCSSCCGDSSTDCCTSACEDEGDGVWRLFGDVELLPGDPCGCRKPLSIFIGGWIQGGITGNGDGNRSSQGNYPVPFNQVSDGFVFNQAPYIYAEKVADTGGAGFDWGARVDYVFGTDGPDTQAFGDEGWDFGWNSSRDYASAIPQLYIDLAYNNVSLRVGHFYTIIGYEVVPAIGNFFYSHALTMNYGEPFTHTGALTTYKPNDNWTFYNGYTFGWDSGFDNHADAHTYLGGVSYAWEDIATFTWAVNTGRFGDGEGLPHGGGAADGYIYMNSFVASINLTDNIEYVFQHDSASNWNIPGAESAQWYGINQYLFITLSDMVKFGARVEWFKDEDGARIGAHPFADPAAVALGPTEGDYFQYTIGLNITPHPNVVIRPELRWDKFEGDAPAGALPFDNGNEDDLFTAGVDAILQF